MQGISKQLMAGRALASVWAIALLLLAAGTGGCGTVQFQGGSKFDPALLEQSLKIGVSAQADVKATLGEPYGQGRALLPFHESDRTVWTYFYERGSVDAATFATQDHRTYLFMFFAGDRLDGYMWFASEYR
jgi:hypothetical protein